jgi:hypothetical protein
MNYFTGIQKLLSELYKNSSEARHGAALRRLKPVDQKFKASHTTQRDQVSKTKPAHAHTHAHTHTHTPSCSFGSLSNLWYPKKKS